VFTKEENAQHHCQIGNVGLKLDVVISWIEKELLLFPGLRNNI